MLKKWRTSKKWGEENEPSILDKNSDLGPEMNEKERDLFTQLCSGLKVANTENTLTLSSQVHCDPTTKIPLLDERTVVRTLSESQSQWIKFGERMTVVNCFLVNWLSKETFGTQRRGFWRKDLLLLYPSMSVYPTALCIRILVFRCLTARR